MWPVMADLSIGAVRADAVFVSGLQRCDEPGVAQVRQSALAAAAAHSQGLADQDPVRLARSDRGGGPVG